MDIICILSFYKDSNLRTGFNSVKLEIRDSKGYTITKKEALLPPPSKLVKRRKIWSLRFSEGTRSLPDNLRSSSMRAIKAKSHTDLEYIKKVKKSSNFLEIKLNTWLSSPEFQPIRDSLLFHCNSSQSAKLIIETEDIELQRLPWHLWNCSKEYINFIEVAISSTQYTQPLIKDKILRKQVRILCILGDSRHINLDEEREALEKIDVYVKFLDEPSKHELNQHLADKQGWDILFFAGHSSSQADGKDGELHLNEKDLIKVSEINQLLKNAVSEGLTVAIFNSCDGIGIANSMANLNIPYVIVMREPVPDRVAQDFFKKLIFEFNQNQQYLSVAVNRARKYLHTLEHIYPCASDLPLLFHNVSVKPLTWQKLPGFTKTPPLQIYQTQKLTKTERKIPEIALPQDCINISFIGDRASGKTTYIASLIRNPNSHISKINYTVEKLDTNAKQLKELAIERIEKGKLLEQNNSPEIGQIRDYKLKIMLNKSPSLLAQFFNSQPQVEEFINLRDFNGQLFNSLGQLKEENISLIQNYPQSWTQSTGIMLAIAITENKIDFEYEQKIEKLLSILKSDSGDFKCQRIAVIFTKCDRSEIFSSYKSLTPQKLAEKYFPRVSHKLNDWEKRSHGELSYFTTSAFGFSGQLKLEANVKKNDLNHDILDRVKCWQPVNLLPPIYWLATGKIHQESDNSN